MTYDVICTRCGATSEIVKPMRAALPTCVECGGALKRLYTIAPVVQYNAPGFASHDTRFRNEIGAERFERFEAQRHDAERRARAGQLSDYERALEAI